MQHFATAIAIHKIDVGDNVTLILLLIGRATLGFLLDAPVQTAFINTGPVHGADKSPDRRGIPLTVIKALEKGNALVQDLSAPAIAATTLPPMLTGMLIPPSDHQPFRKR